MGNSMYHRQLISPIDRERTDDTSDLPTTILPRLQPDRVGVNEMIFDFGSIPSWIDNPYFSCDLSVRLIDHNRRNGHELM